MNKTKVILFSLSLIVLLISIACQASMYISWNLGWQLHLSKLVINNGNYGSHFLDNTPPSLIALYLPVIAFAKWSGINIITTARIFIYLMAIISWIFCYRILNKLFDKHNASLKVLIATAITVIFFIAPAMGFGQAEHWTIFLIMPYLFNTVLTTFNRKNSRALRLWTAIFAGFGFIINPHYLMIFIALEIYLAIHRKSAKTLLRLEAMIIPLVAIMYAISVFIYFPNYLNTILPMHHLLTEHQSFPSWKTLLNNSVTLLWLVVIIFFPFHFKNTHYKPLYSILLITAVGLYLYFSMESHIWYHQMLPSISISMLMLTIYIADDMRQLRQLRRFNIKIETQILLVTIFMYAAILIFPIRDIIVYNRSSIAYREVKSNEINLILNYVNRIATGQWIYIFSASKNPSATIMDYSKTKLANKIPSFKILYGLLNLRKDELSDKEKMKLNTYEALIFNTVIKSFEEKQPSLVIVQSGNLADITRDHAFSFIKYFSKDPRFKAIWSNYHFIYQINDYAFFQRKESSLKSSVKPTKQN